ncbi:ankyrin-1 [Pyrenophora teres f. maculata]|nr:ankyrin-1 [Pyrenophora teres f. maculata]
MYVGESSETFKCSLCPKSFVTTGRYNQHKNTHLKPHECKECLRSFALRSDLTRHIQAKHRLGLARHACLVDGCHFKATRKDNIRQHLRNSHPKIALGATRPTVVPQQEQAHTTLPFTPLSVRSDTGSDLPLACVSTLMQAASSGNFGLCEAVFRLGIEISARADDGSTALHCAVKANQIDMVRFLIQKGIQLDIMNEKNKTALHEAVLGKQESAFIVLAQKQAEIKKHVLYDIIETGQTEIFQIALIHCSNIELESCGSTLFGMAANCPRTAFMDTLLSLPMVTEEWIQRKGSRTLYLLVTQDHTAMIRCLMASGKLDVNMFIRPNERCKNVSIIETAAARGLSDMVSLLLTSDTININNYEQEDTPLNLATIKGHLRVIEILLQHPEISILDHSRLILHGTTPLHLACQYGHFDIMILLLRTFEDHGIPVDPVAGGVTPLQSAVLNGRIDISNPSYQNAVFDVNLSNQGRYTALHIAVILQRTEMVNLLLHHKDIDINKRNISTGQSALDMIMNPPIGSKSPDTEAAVYIKKLLLAHGAQGVVSITEQDSEERLPNTPAEDPQHVTTSRSPAIGVQTAGSSCKGVEGDDQAASTANDFVEYEHSFDIDEWMGFNDFDMDQHDNRSMPETEGFDYPLSTMHDLSTLNSEDNTDYPSSPRHRPWEFGSI